MSPDTKAPRAATQGADGAHASTAPAKTTKARTIAQALLRGSLNRLVHNAVIFEMNVESYRRRSAAKRTSEPTREVPTDPEN
jgi:hypothetical protein